MGKRIKEARRQGRESGWRDALLAVSENADKFHDSLDSEIADSLRSDREYCEAHDASVKRYHRLEWADYLENWASSIGPEPPTIAGVINALRRKSPPFGKMNEVQS